MNGTTTYLLKKKENLRIDTLRKYDLLDSPPDRIFDEYTKLAAQLLHVPIAVISMVDTDRIWFKSNYGLEISQVKRDSGLCASVIMFPDFYEVQNAMEDVRTVAHPWVCGKLGLRFFAAYPLEARNGYNLGSIFVIDKAPRTLTESEKDILKSLRNMVMEQIELRHSTRNVLLNHTEMLGLFAHDLKNPLATINMAADIIQKKTTDPKIVAKMCEHIIQSGKNSLRIIDELLASSQLDSGEFKLQLSKFSMGKLLKEVVESNNIMADKKGQGIELDIEPSIYIKADRGKMGEIMDNLINNAIKYSNENKQIKISLQTGTGKFRIEIKDNGPGLTEMDKKNLFKRFSKLSAQPTGNEISTGLGLYIAKLLVLAHKGHIWAESDGKNKGSSFIMEFPMEYPPSRKIPRKKRNDTSLVLED